jgi:polyhydroxybutyrate depolymerase
MLRSRPTRRPAAGCEASRARLVASAAFALALASCLAVAPAAAGTFVESATLAHGGITRWYDLYLPDGSEAAVPLLIVLHGGTQSNDVLRSGAALELRALADAERFVIAFPNGTASGSGTSGPSGSFNWNDCRGDAGPADTVADDTGFIGALIDAVAARRPIDLERVYVTGASNGGMMAYRVALELSDRIAAVAASIANQPANSECRDAPEQPLSVLIMNGTADAIMPWQGGQVGGNRGLVLSAEATRDFWRARLGTGDASAHTDFPDLDPDDVGTVSSDLYAGGRDGSEVLFYRVENGGHVPPSIAYRAGGAQNRDVEATHEFWRFLSRQRRTGGASGRASGVQLSPDGQLVLVSKDVGGERWAITYVPQSGDVTGNVFRPDGGAPAFVACERTSADPGVELLAFACRGADACPAAPCLPDAWTDLGTAELPASFFAPPAGARLAD